MFDILYSLYFDSPRKKILGTVLIDAYSSDLPGAYFLYRVLYPVLIFLTYMALTSLVISIYTLSGAPPFYLPDDYLAGTYIALPGARIPHLTNTLHTLLI